MKDLGDLLFSENTSINSTSVKSIPPAWVAKVPASWAEYMKPSFPLEVSFSTSDEDDFSLLNNPIFTLLTGGIDSVNGKTWVIDSARQGHFGVGPNPSSIVFGDYPEFYEAGVNEKANMSSLGRRKRRKNKGA